MMVMKMTMMSKKKGGRNKENKHHGSSYGGFQQQYYRHQMDVLLLVRVWTLYWYENDHGQRSDPTQYTSMWNV